MKNSKPLYSLVLCVLSYTTQTNSNSVVAEISFGELVDKITILTIKSKRISDPHKLKNIETELYSLRETLNNYLDQHANSRNDINALEEELYINNNAQWDMEDTFRALEKVNDFGDEFIANARKIRVSNDRRCLTKKKIDELCGCRFTEEKSYDELG